MNPKDIKAYRNLVAQQYPSAKRRGDGKTCIDARQSLLNDLQALSDHDLRVHQLRICLLAYDACQFVESGPGKGNLCGFAAGVEPLLYAVLSRIGHESARNVLAMIQDIEFQEHYHRPPFISGTEESGAESFFRAQIMADGEVERDGPQDDFEDEQWVDEGGSENWGFDNTDGEEGHDAAQ